VSDSQNDTEPTAGGAAEPIVAPEADSRDDTISLLDLILVLARRWRLIFFTTFFAAVGIVLFSIYTIRMPPDSPYNPLPNVYEPSSQVLLNDPSTGGGLSSALSNSDLGIIAGLAGISGGSNNSAALAQSLLRGNWIIDQIVGEFGLLDSFADSENQKTSARNSVRESLTAEFDAGSGILLVRFKSIDPVFAADVLLRVVELLEARFTFLTRDDARARSEAIQFQLTQLEDDVDLARADFAAFQRRYGVIDPVAQSSQTLELIAEYRIQLFDLQRQRQQLRQYVEDPSDPQIQRVDREIELLGVLVNELETGFTVYSPLSIPRDELGQITVRYLDLQRDLQLKQEIYFTFQAEMVRARIEAQDTSRVFQVIEPAEVPEVKTSPSRGTICVIVTITAFFLSVFLAFVLEYFNRAHNDPREAQKMETIRNQFRFRRRES
jgi:tyrosine-protein kinase Etk/Wzc